MCCVLCVVCCVCCVVYQVSHLVKCQATRMVSSVKIVFSRARLALWSYSTLRPPPEREEPSSTPNGHETGTLGAAPRASCLDWHSVSRRHSRSPNQVSGHVKGVRVLFFLVSDLPTLWSDATQRLPSVAEALHLTHATSPSHPSCLPVADFHPQFVTNKSG